jgi:hypothetical protein
MGVRLPLSVEVISTDLLQRPVGEVARRLADTTRAVVAAASAQRVVDGGDGRPPGAR